MPPRISSLLAVLALAAASLSAKTEGFIRPMAYVVIPHNEGYSASAGAGFAGGLALGDKSQHELGAEIGYSRWDSSASGYGYSAAATEHLVPMLANYRFRFGGAEAKFRPYIGPSLGVTYYRVNYAANSQGYGISGWSSDATATIAGSVGALVRLGAWGDLDVGYRYLHAAAPSLSIDGYTVTGDPLRASIFHAGLNIRF